MKKIKFCIIFLFMRFALHGYSQSNAYSDRKVTVDLNFNMLNAMAEKHSFIIATKKDYEVEVFMITYQSKFEKTKQSAFEIANFGQCALIENKQTDQPI